ncbi:hypothetical protein OTSUT76_0225 [Orientia tsutsugamushi str. UT76]|nr:hypothetical protein OTSUT76_0225 [Orientia tsutsugamushi str. UT76]
MFDGIITVLVSLAILDKASIYCSAIRSETASLPPVLFIACASFSIPSAVAFATNNIAQLHLQLY